MSSLLPRYLTHTESVVYIDARALARERGYTESEREDRVYMNHADRQRALASDECINASVVASFDNWGVFSALQDVRGIMSESIKGWREG